MSAGSLFFLSRPVPGSGEVETVKVHYFFPHLYKVVQELLLGVLTSVDFRQGPELGVRTEDQVDTGAGPLEGIRLAIAPFKLVRVFRNRFPLRAHIEQAWWHAQTGYLPVSKSALSALPADHFQKNPDMWTAFNQIMSGKTTNNSLGIRLGNFAAIRDNIEAEMENVVGGKKTPKQGLDDAVKNSSKVLKEFSSLYK